ncbi:MAG: hypothetical protein ACLBM6_13505, partial [Cuspidothrix sp.]
METSVSKTLRAKICFGALKNSRWGDVIWRALTWKKLCECGRGVLPRYKIYIPVVNRVVLNLVFPSGVSIWC